MNCPKCNSVRLRVLDSRPTIGNEVRRRRKCELCGYRFTTYELTAVKRAKLNNR